MKNLKIIPNSNNLLKKVEENTKKVYVEFTINCESQSENSERLKNVSSIMLNIA